MNVRGLRQSARFGFAALVGVLGAAALLLGCDNGAHSALDATSGSASGGSASGASSTTTSGAGGATTGGSSTAGSNGSSGGAAGTSAAVGDSLAQKYADFFPIGAAIGDFQLNFLEQVLTQDFNHLTCENAMKAEDLHPTEDAYYWTDADRVADFARQHGMKMTGHALLWHQRTPVWMLAGATATDAASLEVVKARLKAHIDAVVGRYADVVDNWDVVNEALSDDPAKQYRDGPEGSTWFDAFGSQEYIYWAYKYAKDALEAKSPGSSAGKLYYNEYTATVKADKILKLLAWLKDEKGIQIDGVGFQSHENMSWPSVTDLQTAIDKFKTAGYKVKISELDITVYSDYSTGSFVASPAVQWTPDLEAKQAKRFGDLFALYRKNKGQITSVTFWGLSDDHTWLDNSPVEGRNDFPLLYNDQHTPKAARAALMAF
jgi:endo-1,4-beta-xylanase